VVRGGRSPGLCERCVASGRVHSTSVHAAIQAAGHRNLAADHQEAKQPIVTASARTPCFLSRALSLSRSLSPILPFYHCPCSPLSLPLIELRVDAASWPPPCYPPRAMLPETGTGSVDSRKEGKESEEETIQWSVYVVFLKVVQARASVKHSVADFPKACQAKHAPAEREAFDAMLLWTEYKYTPKANNNKNSGGAISFSYEDCHAWLSPTLGQFHVQAEHGEGHTHTRTRHRQAAWNWNCGSSPDPDPCNISTTPAS
jgi:hypothetical protein